MTTLNEQFERYHGDRLIEWINESRQAGFSFESRGDEAPDLVYICGANRLGVEVTAAYYDPEHAKFLWDGARNADEQSQGWTGANPDVNLAREVLERIRDKSTKDYGRGCILLVVVPPGVTSHAKLCHLLSQSDVGQVPFDGIYVAGTFPNIDLDPATGGYRVIPIREWSGAHAMHGS